MPLQFYKWCNYDYSVIETNLQFSWTILKSISFLSLSLWLHTRLLHLSSAAQGGHECFLVFFLELLTAACPPLEKDVPAGFGLHCFRRVTVVLPMNFRLYIQIIPCFSQYYRQFFSSFFIWKASMTMDITTQYSSNSIWKTASVTKSYHVISLSTWEYDSLHKGKQRCAGQNQSTHKSYHSPKDVVGVSLSLCPHTVPLSPSHPIPVVLQFDFFWWSNKHKHYTVTPTQLLHKQNALSTMMIWAIFSKATFLPRKKLLVCLSLKI